jgi:non-ribosomal peptide synthetase component F
MTQFQYDFSLLSTLLDHWRPATHTFHFTVSEMTMTLQDTSLLMGLPCAGEPVRVVDISVEWSTEFLARFANVLRNDHAPVPSLTHLDLVAAV